MAIEDPLTDREKKLLNQVEPTLSKNPPGIDLPAVLSRFRDAIQTEIDAQVAGADEADEIAFDNTTAALPGAPDNVQDAIDALDAVVDGISAGGITGDHAALENPTMLDELVDFIDPLWRPEYSAPSVAGALGGVVNVATTGSDVTGDGSVATPFATVARAAQLIGRSNPSNVDIQLGPGTFNLPGLIAFYNWITIKGTTSDLETATQSGAAFQADEEALVIDVTGITSGGAVIDDLRGTHIQWTSGPANNRKGWIRRNDITGTVGPGITRLTVSQDDVTSLRVPVAGNTLKLISLDTTARLTEFFNVFINAVQCNVHDLVMSDTAGGTFVMFPLNTDKIGCRNVRFDIGRVQVGRYGGCEFYNCYLANLGNANRGLLAVTRNGDCTLIRGTVIDGDLRATADANRFVEIQNGGKLSTDGNSVFMGLNTRGIQMDGADVATQDPRTAHHVWSFDECDAGIVINSLDGPGLSGWYALPNLHGEVVSTYAVTAKECACVELGATSALRTASGGGTTNAVSADGGATAVAEAPDTTYIANGAPAAVGFQTLGSAASVLVKTDAADLAVDASKASATFTTLLSLNITPASAANFLKGLFTASGSSDTDSSDFRARFRLRFGPTGSETARRATHIFSDNIDEGGSCALVIPKLAFSSGAQHTVIIEWATEGGNTFDINPATEPDDDHASLAIEEVTA